ncbi:hypothetical protein TanjilG_30278 [Lupinus angustifolius]|uniref:Uncharacterized protein n=1 Tax=Lupinus angustifolius TaxID=3871 RepID=A0A4P1R7N8_LUPAN|nr:hypothetical protein TanjilG_30278 [Lupinus angustifolius]
MTTMVKQVLLQERYEGRWICGLCVEAVKEERMKSQRDVVMMITIDEAFKRHIKFCQQFKSSTPPNDTSEEFILAMKQILFPSLDSPRKDHGFNCRPLARSQVVFQPCKEQQQ